MNARRTGVPDPQLLALAGQVLTSLLEIATDTTATVGAAGDDENIDPERGPL